MIWILSHKKILGNEKADELAKRSAQEGLLLEREVPYSDIVNIFKARCTKENEKFPQQKARVQNKGTFFFKNYWKHSSRPWFFYPNFNRKAIVTINRLRSGHNSLKISLFRFKIIGTNLFLCGQIEDENHILWECDKFTKERSTMVENFNRLKIRTPIDIRKILKKMNPEELLLVIEYFNSCKINI